MRPSLQRLNAAPREGNDVRLGEPAKKMHHGFLSPSHYLSLCEVNPGSRLQPFNHRVVLFISSFFLMNSMKKKKVLSRLLGTLLL